MYRNFAEELRHDHAIIQKMVAGGAAVAELLQAGKQVEPSILTSLSQFLAVFAQSCHHRKEEEYLFPLLKSMGSPDTSRQLRALEQQHRAAADLAQQLARSAQAYAVDPLLARRAVVEALNRIAELYSRHIWREDYMLLPEANRSLSEAEQEFLAEKFEQVEMEIGPDVHRAFEELTERLQAVVEYHNSGACPLCSPSA